MNTAGTFIKIYQKNPSFVPQIAYADVFSVLFYIITDCLWRFIANDAIISCQESSYDLQYEVDLL